METFGTILLVLNSILVIIAGISVLVAAVNIMNTMYTAVLERTKEIGIMKSIGARNSTILLMFFFESGFLGLIGGSIGMLLGYGLAKLGAIAIAATGYSFLQPYFPWWLIVGCLVFSFSVGAASGFFPARAASKLKPVDALRYE
jgi:putative ABC transport system permease protein